MGRILKITRSQNTPALIADVRSGRALVVRPFLLKAAMVLTGVGALAASSWISVPFYPVPMTMQTLAVLLVGGFLGPRLGVAAITSYLVLGLTGAPVFHNGLGGLVVMAGPTGGYLVGFVPAAFLMGLASRGVCTARPGRLNGPWRAALLIGGAVLAGAAIYVFGLSWLAVTTGMGAGEVASVGLVPFLLGDLVKTGVAVTAVLGGNNLLARWGSLPF